MDKKKDVRQLEIFTSVDKNKKRDSRTTKIPGWKKMGFDRLPTWRDH